jgi:hypothetical protein
VRTRLGQAVRDGGDPRLAARAEVVEERLVGRDREQAAQRVVGARESRLTVTTAVTPREMARHEVERRAAQRTVERGRELLHGEVDHAARPSSLVGCT